MTAAWWPLSRLLRTVRPAAPCDGWLWPDCYDRLMSGEYRWRTVTVGRDVAVWGQRRPVLIGGDGVLCDGHHRVVGCIWAGLGGVLVKVAP